MKIILDPFDTEIFTKDVYKLYWDREIGNRSLKPLEKIKKGIIFCFTIFSPKNSSILSEAGFNLISIRNTYKLDLNAYLKKKITGLAKKYKVLDRSQSVKLLTKNNLLQLAKTIHETSRYSKDLLLDKDKSLQIYINWVQNSLYKNYASEVFLVFDKLESAGIITVKIKNGKGFIDLLGVIKKYQNQKLATHLLKKAVDYLKGRGIDSIFVISEGENIPANIFYQKNNFILQNTELVYHKHI